jgi:predicted ATP-grasp superfamily ATP-dependent carboligase
VSVWHVDVLIPVTDAAMLAILEAREQLGDVQIPFPDLETFRRVSDKALVLETAPQFGIRVPKQCLLQCRDAFDSIADEPFSFPVVLKASRSVGGGPGRHRKHVTRYAADRIQLYSQLAEMDASAFPVLLQRWLRGPGIGVFLLLWQGRTLAVFSHRRIREKPPSGGVSVYAESVPADPVLVSQSRALLESLGWQGVAMVEYKIDDVSGSPYLMEINGRFWGSLQLAVDAGVDFPTLLLSAAAGNQPEPVLEYRTGLRSRWWWGDVDHLLSRLRRSTDGLDLRHAPSRWQTVRQFLTLWKPGDRNEVLRLGDPRPFLRETIDWFKRR